MPIIGPSWVASIVNKIGKSKYWKSSAIIVVWDDWGGYYDHVPPPLYDKQGGLGFRFSDDHHLPVRPSARRAHTV